MNGRGEATRGLAPGFERPFVAPVTFDALFAKAAAQVGIGAWACNLADDSLEWTPGIYDLFGLSPFDRFDRRDALALYEEESRETLERLRADAIAHARPFTMEAQIVRPDGTRRWMRLSADVVRDNGRATRLFGLKQDITDDKRRLEVLRQLAERDALTGLMNRTAYQNTFINAPRAQPGISPLGALVLLDLDGFKQVNDRFGHAAGDACLKMVGERLAGAFADMPMVARIGGDEFAVLVGAGTSPHALERRVKRLLVHLAQPIAWRGLRLAVGASAGMVCADDPYCYDAEALFMIADAALYTAKAAGRGSLRVGHTGVPHDLIVHPAPRSSATWSLLQAHPSPE